MKRWILFGVTSILLTFSLLPRAAGAVGNVNDFTISDYNIHYLLSRDTEGRSNLTTEETITATFPDTDQNHGIERFIPKDYDDHPTNLDILSVQDQNGQARNYTTYSSGEYTVVRIGDANQYVHGEQTYKLVYTQRDVTKYFTDKNRDEFYWDTNGTEWRVPIQNLSVDVEVSDDIASAMKGDNTCYQGRQQDDTTCAIEQTDTGFHMSAANMQPGENITVALGFKPQTFSGYKISLLGKLTIVWIILQFVLVGVTLGLMGWLVTRYFRIRMRKGEQGTIVTEYVPPQNASIQTAAAIISARSTFSAQIIDLAVRHYLKIYEVKPKKLWSSGEYTITIDRDVSSLRDEEREFLSDLMRGTTIGRSISTKTLKRDYGLAMRLADNPRKLRNLMRENYGFEQKDPAQSKRFGNYAIAIFIASVVLLSPILLIPAITALIMSFTLYVLTDKGLALYRYMEGLKLYISVAEQERLRVLQSPEGANKISIDPNDPKQLVELYEKLLPYAMLFGQEKQWNKQLGDYYKNTNTQPTWYGGSNLAAFNAASFASSMNGLTSSINSSGAASSSSGGSGGGGSSGGGGGGGGGGGW